MARLDAGHAVPAPSRWLFRSLLQPSPARLAPLPRPPAARGSPRIRPDASWIRVPSPPAAGGSPAVDINRLTIITSGIALISGCIPPSSKSMHPLKITVFSLSGQGSQVMAQTEPQIGSLGNALTGVMVAFSSDSRACALPFGIKGHRRRLR